jgi:hypothetical protein
LVKRRPRTVAELHAAVWWVHPQDAPKRNAIKAHIWLLNRELVGERVVGEWLGAPWPSRSRAQSVGHIRGERRYRLEEE